MIAIDRYLNEVLVHGNFGKNLEKYSRRPKTKEELQDIIRERIKNEGPECDLNDIDVFNITDMGFLFEKSSFNGDISQWNVSNVENMTAMFNGCEKFNGDLSNWDVSNVNNMQAMFNGCEKFNSDISKWDVSNVTNMEYMFQDCEIFNQDISQWNTENVQSMKSMFCNCYKFNQDISKWNVKNVVYNLQMFYSCRIDANYKPKFK